MSTPTDPTHWLQEHGDALFAYAKGRVRDPSVAEDLVQETLLAAFRDRDRYEGRSTERTWLFGILRYKLLDHWRRTARGPMPLEDALEQEVDALFTRFGKWRQPLKELPDAPAEQDEVVAALERCLERLPARSAEAFLLRERHGMEIERLSQVLSITTTNTWQILHRARTALRECLERSLTDDPRPRS